MAKVWIALMSKMIYNLIDLASWVGLNSPFFVKDWESCFLPRMNSYEQLEALSPPCFVYMETAKMKYLDSVVLFFKWISFIYSYMYSLCDFAFFSQLLPYPFFPDSTVSRVPFLILANLVPKICIRNLSCSIEGAIPVERDPGVIVLDEAHERSANTDLLLGLLLGWRIAAERIEIHGKRVTRDGISQMDDEVITF